MEPRTLRVRDPVFSPPKVAQPPGALPELKGDESWRSRYIKVVREGFETSEAVEDFLVKALSYADYETGRQIMGHLRKQNRGTKRYMGAESQDGGRTESAEYGEAFVRTLMRGMGEDDASSGHEPPPSRERGPTAPDEGGCGTGRGGNPKGSPGGLPGPIGSGGSESGGEGGGGDMPPIDPGGFIEWAERLRKVVGAAIEGMEKSAREEATGGNAGEPSEEDMVRARHRVAKDPVKMRFVEAFVAESVDSGIPPETHFSLISTLAYIAYESLIIGKDREKREREGESRDRALREERWREALDAQASLPGLSASEADIGLRFGLSEEDARYVVDGLRALPQFQSMVAQNPRIRPDEEATLILAYMVARRYGMEPKTDAALKAGDYPAGDAREPRLDMAA